jgi:uncharacterized protein YkwD
MNAEDAKHLNDLITAHRQRLRILEIKAAQAGRSCPPEVLTEIQEITEQIQKIEQVISKDSMTFFEGRNALNTINSNINHVDDRIKGIVVREERVVRLFGFTVLTQVITRTILVAIFSLFLVGIFGVLTGLIKVPPFFIQRLPTTTPGPTTVDFGTSAPTNQPTEGATAVAEEPVRPIPVTLTNTATPTPQPTLTPSPFPTPTPLPTLTPRPTRTPLPTNTPVPTFHPPAAVDEKREERVIILINDYRAGNGCEPLRYSSELTGAARRHSVDMATHDFFDHNGSDGTDPGQRITQAGYNWAYGIPGTKGWTQIIDTGITPDDFANSIARGNGGDDVRNCNYHDVGVGYAVSSNGTPYWTVLLTRGRR